MEDVLSFEEGTVWVTLHREAHVGARPADDVRPPRHREPLAQAGKPLTAKLVEKLVEAGVEKIPLRGGVAGGPPHGRAHRGHRER